MDRTFFALLLVSLLVPLLDARPFFKPRIPNGDRLEDPSAGISCGALGHTQCVPGAPRNPFGLAFKAAGLRWTVALCRSDSDGDGLTNGEEMGDPCCVWKPGKKPTRTTMLSHPGFKEEDGAKNAPKCKQTEKGLPSVCGEGSKGKRNTIVAACVCFVVARGMVVVASRRMVVRRCVMLFGNTTKIRSFRFACQSFRLSSGMLNTRMIMRNLSVLGRC